MSYLATEIGLELLGYKFYDTNGVFHSTIFQQSMAADQNDFYPEEPSLADFIDQPSNSDAAQNGHGTNITTDSSGPSSSMDPSTKESNRMLNGHEKQQSKELNNYAAPVPQPVLQKMSIKPRDPPTKVLAKILDYECCTIRSQVSQRLEAALRKNSTVNKETHQLECLDEEKKKLLDDAEDLQKFRLFLEERLRNIDSRPYAAYARTFGNE